jgi:hypothetical protein
MTTPYLNIPELSGSESEPYPIVNALARGVEQAVAGRRTINFASDANYTLVTTAGSEEWRDKFLTFTDSGVVLTTGRDVIFPAEEGPEYIIKNSTAQTLTLKISGQTGVTIATTVTGRYYYDGTDIVAAP